MWLASFLIIFLSFNLLSPAKSSSLNNGTVAVSATNWSLGAGGKQTAPYAIEDNSMNKSISERKNILLRLTLNETSSDASRLAGDLKERWLLSDQNGTLLGEREDINLHRLLDTLNSKNLTSEVQYDELRPGQVNIIISRWQQSGPPGNDITNESGNQLLLLEDLLEESSRRGEEPAMNVSAVLRDNHRLIARYPARSKPASSIDPPVGVAITAPPLHRTQDVVAANYTSKKIANEANIFALRLLEQLNIERLGNENLINSPFAIYQGLALLLAGSMGDTSRELDRLLLSVQSMYENVKLTHDQDRARLMASLGDVVRQLQQSATNHLQRSPVGAGDQHRDCEPAANKDNLLSIECQRQLSRSLDKLQYGGGTEGQHLIVANNLLFSPHSYEISNEFKWTLNNYHNNTALMKMETGSTESIQVVNNWIRQATAGLIPVIIGKRNTFDEFNVMTFLSTSWLAQEWRHPFRRVASPIRSSVRLKGQTVARSGWLATAKVEPLMEFVDDQKSSHFVEYIKSPPTRAIQNFHAYLNKQLVDLVVVPFRNSNQRLVTLTPLAGEAPSSGPSIMADINRQLAVLNQTMSDFSADLEPQAPDSPGRNESQQAPAESSLLSKMIANFSTEPRKVLRQLWNTIAPEIITKQTIQSALQASAAASSSSQNGANLSTGQQSFPLPIPPRVQLSMPLIRLEADSSLTAALNHIGLVNAFDPAQANFIGINGHPFNYNKLHLSNVVYKTTFNLNEDGINYDRTVRTLESMRISAHRRGHDQNKAQELDGLESGELVNEVRLDRPFMFLLCDIKTRLILYTGIVRNPAH